MNIIGKIQKNKKKSFKRSKRKTKTNMSSKIWCRIFWTGRNKKDKNKRNMYRTFKINI